MRLFLGLSLVLGLACSNSTEPVGALVPGSSLDVTTAYVRWRALSATSYTFEIKSQGAWFPSPGYYRAAVADGQITSVYLMSNAEPRNPKEVPTIDALWSSMQKAAAKNELSQTSFSSEGIPITATVGRFESDAGTMYKVRAFTLER